MSLSNTRPLTPPEALQPPVAPVDQMYEDAKITIPQHSSPFQQQSQEPQIDPSQYGEVPLSQDELYANVMNENRIQNLISQISPDNQLYEIEMRLKGYKKNIFNGAWEKIDARAPELNAVLVSRYVAFISSILNQNTSLSNIDSQQINKLMKITIEYIVDDLDANAEQYNLVSDYTERSRIGYMMLNVLFMVLNRARDGMESRRMWKALNVTESGTGEQTKKGALDFMKFWQ